MSVFGVIKEHPYIAGGAVLGTVVLVFMLSGGSSEAGTAVVTSGGVQSDPNQAALLATQVQAGVRNNEINAQLEALNIAADRDRHTADLAYGVQLNDSNNAADVALATLSTQQTLGLATIAATTTVTLGAQETDRYKSKLVSDEMALESNNSLALALNNNSTAIKVNQDNIAYKQTADILSANTANHAIDAAATSAAADRETAKYMQQRDLDSLWIRQQFQAQHEQNQNSLAYTAAMAQLPFQLAATQAQYGAQVAVAQAQNDHGAFGFGPISYRW